MTGIMKQKTDHRHIGAIIKAMEHRIAAAAFVTAVIAMCTLPVMSVDLSDAERGILFVRGYNLIEFSVFGCIPIIAPLFIPVLMVGGTDKNNYIAMLCGFSVYMVCYIHGINAAEEWFASICSNPITYHAGIIIYPAAFVLTLIAAKIISEYDGRKDTVR